MCVCVNVCVPGGGGVEQLYNEVPALINIQHTR